MPAMEKRYSDFLCALRGAIGEDRIYTDCLRTFAWGTDANFYRLVPKILQIPAARLFAANDSAKRTGLLQLFQHLFAKGCFA